VHAGVVDLVIDVHESIPQLGEATEPAGQHVVDDAVRTEDGEAVPKSRGARQPSEAMMWLARSMHVCAATWTR
jgi:hypothetical protein